jgi:hypothetical protein
MLLDIRKLANRMRNATGEIPDKECIGKSGESRANARRNQR